MAARATTPPATPPAIAPVFDPLPEDEEEEEEAGEEEGVAVTTAEAEEDTPDREALEVGLILPEAEVAINEPGCTSGVSPTVNAVLAFQRFALVLSRRAHCGTRVPEGTALGNVEGVSVFVQLNAYSDQVIHVAPWHASQALMRLYVTVLHLHKFASSTPLGPVYENPGCSASMVNAPPLHVAIIYAATVHAFWPRVLNDHFQDKLQSGATI